MLGSCLCPLAVVIEVEEVAVILAILLNPTVTLISLEKQTFKNHSHMRFKRKNVTICTFMKVWPFVRNFSVIVLKLKKFTAIARAVIRVQFLFYRQ